MSSFFSPFTPAHVNLVNACYPSTSILLAAGSTCQPLPQELSRLTYYASNVADSSGKLAKVAIELEKRASSESRKARGGNAKARAQMLVTVSIFKAITNECKRDVGLFTKMLISATRDAITCLPNDLEVQARVSSLFTAWATYTDGSIIGRDLRVTNEYIFLLKTFYERCIATGKDSEQVNRMRLIGVAAMTAAVSSDAFYASSTEFPKQVEIAIPALVASLHEAGTNALKTESSVVCADPAPNSPYLSEFQPRPVMDRRAASIHAHIDGQKGPELSDVVNASLRALRALLGRCNGGQVGKVMDAILLTIDKARLWEDKNLGEWYAERVIEWSQYQYRYAVPTKLVEKLLAIQESPTPSAKHFTLVQMLISIFTSPFPLINLSTSEVISSLITVILRRVSINANDELLPSLVECASSLGTHVYYADQIHDLAEEVVARIVNVQVNGVLGRGRAGNEPARDAALSCLLSVLSGLTEAADRHAAKYRAKLAEGETLDGEGLTDGKATPDIQTTEDGSRPSRPPSESTTTTTIRAARRNKVSPESWQDTLALMCESNYNIRAMYARGLASFVQKEVKKEPFVEQEPSGASASSPAASSSSLSPRRKVKVVVDPNFKASSRPSILASDPVSRFLNALHASAYTLAASVSPNKPAGGSAKQMLSEPLASDAPNANDTAGIPPIASINIIPPSTSNLPSAEGNTPEVNGPAVIDFAVQEATAPPSPVGLEANQPPMTAASSTSNTSYQPPGTANTVTTTGGDGPSRRQSRHHTNGRKLSVALNLLEGSQAEVTATLSDFSLLHYIMVTTHTQVPCRAVLTGVPMLLALEQMTRKFAGSEEYVGGVRAIRELVCRTWLVIGEVWGISPVVESASNALKALGQEILPELPSIPPTRINTQEQPIEFPQPPPPLSSETSGIVDAEIVLPALASCTGLQAITGLDRQGLLRRFTIEWTVEAALKDSVEHTSNQDILRGETPFLRLSPALMHIDNVSLASLARSTHGGVGVSELREALGRGGASNPALATSSMKSSTIDRRSSIGTGTGSGRSPRRSISGRSNNSTALSVGGRPQPLEPLAISRIKSKRGKAAPSEVRDVLNKLGIGKQSGGGSFLKTPFPSQSQKDKDPTSPTEPNGKTQESMVEPPY